MRRRDEYLLRVIGKRVATEMLTGRWDDAAIARLLRDASGHCGRKARLVGRLADDYGELAAYALQLAAGS